MPFVRVAPVSLNLVEAHIAEIFSTFGEVLSVEVPPRERVCAPFDVDTDEAPPAAEPAAVGEEMDGNACTLWHSGFAVIEYASTKEVRVAQQCMDGGQIDGCVVAIETSAGDTSLGVCEPGVVFER